MASTKLRRGRGGKERLPSPACIRAEQLTLAPAGLPTHPRLTKRLAEPQPDPAWSVFDLDSAPVVKRLDLYLKIPRSQASC